MVFNLKKFVAALNAVPALRKKKIGPLKVSQVLHLPLGPLFIVQVGDLNKGLLPTASDLEAVAKAANALAAKTVGLKGTKFEFFFFPPFLRVKTIFFNNGAFHLFTLGDLKHGILPSVKDLDKLMRLVAPVLKRLGDKEPMSMFYPPIVDVSLAGTVVVAMLGSPEHNIVPSAKDAKQLKQLLKECIKGAYLIDDKGKKQMVKVMVSSGSGHFRSDAKAFV